MPLPQPPRGSNVPPRRENRAGEETEAHVNHAAYDPQTVLNRRITRVRRQGIRRRQPSVAEVQHGAARSSGNAFTAEHGLRGICRRRAAAGAVIARHAAVRFAYRHATAPLRQRAYAGQVRCSRHGASPACVHEPAPGAPAEPPPFSALSRK